MELGKALKDTRNFQRIIEHIKAVQRVFGEERHKAVPLFDDVVRYPLEQVISLAKISNSIFTEEDPAKRDALIAKFVALRVAVKPLENAPERIYLWPDGNMPVKTKYTENTQYQYNHDPDFKPYMFEMLLSENVQPKGAIIVCPGGDHGECSVYEGYQVCRDLNAVGYQCFLLQNRPNGQPWSKEEAGADVARAIRIVRKHAAKYRIPEDRVAYAGFSNGGLTGEACIQFYSGKQEVKDHFPEHIPDELDVFYGAPDAFLNIYGPRMRKDKFSYKKVVYPPTFLATGREDNIVMDNLHALYPDLIKHGVQVEMHTFAGAEHGVASRSILDGEDCNPSFQLWIPLADYFLQDVYKNRSKG